MGKRTKSLADRFEEGGEGSMNTALNPWDKEAFSGKHRSKQPGDEATSAHMKLQHRDPTIKKKMNNNRDLKLTRGAKRDASGNIKDSAKEKQNRGQDAISDRARDKQTLLEEIITLGGTEDDLNLVADAISDEEGSPPNTPAAVDKSLRNELADFVARLNIPTSMNDIDNESVISAEHEDSQEQANQVTVSGKNRVVPTPRTGITTTEARSRDATLSNHSNRLILDPQPDWHAASLPALPDEELNSSPRYDDDTQRLKDYALSLLEADSKLYSSKYLSASSSHRFLSTIMSSGTLSDKVSALTLIVQESPIHTMKSLESLLVLAKKRSRGQAVTALGALKDLFGTGTVLPSDRRLRSFAAQPGLLNALQKSSGWTLAQRLPGKVTEAHLVSWAYEDWLKGFYFELLKVLEGWCNDEVEYARTRAVTYVYELLKEKPEQESNLLRLLVNKLGDPSKKIASRASYLILQLQISHPMMKQIIVNSIRSELLLRPGQSTHAKYYAVNTLNQTILSTKEEAVAKELLSLYFEMFVSLLKKPEISKPLDVPMVNRKGQLQGGGGPMGKKAKARLTKTEEAKLANEEMTEKMISAVLTGVNRALPFSKADDLTLEEHMDTLFRITHSSNFNTSIQALMLIEQLATTKRLAVDRFYRTLYESLLDPRLVTSSKHALYLNLLFRSLNSDLNVKRVKAFVKRILQVVSLHQPPFICGIMYLLQELEVTFPGLKSLRDEPEEHEGSEEESFHDASEDVGESIAKNASGTAALEHRMLYDGRKRDPEHSNADRSCLWEMIPFIVHFHPSVALFANRLLSDGQMPPKPDLASHTLSSFLDRFVYRNAKASFGGPRGNSIMQPLAGVNHGGILVHSKADKKARKPLNSESFWHQKAEEIAVDEVFFHRYFNKVGRSKRISDETAKSAERSGVTESGDDEDEIWEALVNSRPEVEGDSDQYSDMLTLDESDGVSNHSEYTEDSEEFGARSSDADQHGLPLEAQAGQDSSSELEVDFESHSDEEQEPQLSDTGSEKEGRRESNRTRRKMLKNLPTFASVDDYADMMVDEVDEDL